MAMSRSSSPASPGGSPEPLTPRSKIRALLAAVDDSDDETSNAIRSLGASNPTISTTRGLQRPRATLGLALSDDSDESEEDVRPRGRLASRMQGAAAQPQSVPRPLEQAPAVTQQQLASGEGDIGSTADTESDDDGLPQAPRRLKRKLVSEGAVEDSATTPRSPSPGLFVSSPLRPSPAKSIIEERNEELELPALKSDRFKALVERKKQERLAREAEEEAKKAERLARQEKILSELDAGDSNVSDITDDEGGRKLTQEARPTRRASKKAIEEMNRETQRMNRNMQLAHEAKTRKKITTNSLFEKFNFRPAADVQSKTASSSRPSSPHSDVEMNDVETPPTSPPALGVSKPTTAEVAAPLLNQDAGVDEVPRWDQVPLIGTTVADKGEGKAVAPLESTKKQPTKPKRQVRIRLPQPAAFSVMVDGEDELEITTTTKDKINAVFDSIPTKKADSSHSFQALKALAKVKSPGKENRRRNEQPGMSMGELEASLYQRMRQQAKVERDKRLNMLKAQGVVIQTTEERERQMEEVEDLVAKAREEAQQIMAQERADAKKNKDAGEEADPLAWDDSEDEDFQDPANEADVEDVAGYSGSEEEFDDEKEGDSEDENEDEEEAAGKHFFDGSASEAESEQEAVGAEKIVQESDAEMDEDAELPARRRPRKQIAVLSDDEADVEATPRPTPMVQATPNAKSVVQATPKAPSTVSPAPGSVLRSARKNFIPGLPVAGPAGLGLTQIFAGTMDDSQMSAGQGPTQSMMPDFDNFPDSNFSATMDDIPNGDNLPNRMEETQGETQAVRLDLSQSQMHGFDSLPRDVPGSQLSDILEVEPSQDGGLQKYTPLRERYVEPPNSTVDTVVLGQEDIPQESPLVRRGRLRRKVEGTPELAQPAPTTIQSTDAEATAFNAIQEGAKKERKRQLLDDYNRKKSKAKEMVEEQAEESEDEYQGLGGVDGEDSDNDSATSVKDMIDDQTQGNDLDEAKLAAFYADRERANDEKQVEQLFKDITSGMLRRKRGADYDLSDSDDGGEARRRMKRRQFAKMQKALFADERVKKMAENPGNQAFLRTIEDHGSDDEMDILDIVGESSQHEHSSSQQDAPDQAQGGQQNVVPDSQPRAALGNASENNARDPPRQRRTKAGRKPADIGEVRETLSNLLDEREGSVVPATEAGSDSEDDDDGHNERTVSSDKENYQPNPRRSVRPAAVIDRISLKRNSSTSSNASSHGASSSFKVPALLRRATTNSFKSTASSASSTGVSTPTFGAGSGGGFGSEAKIKKAAGKRSGVNAFARDSERRAKLHEGERRREQKKVKGAERRAGAVGSLLGRGSFE